MKVYLHHNRSEYLEQTRFKEKGDSITIEMFTASWCPPCRSTKTFLFGVNLSKEKLQNSIEKCLHNPNFKTYSLFQTVHRLKDQQIKHFFELGKDTLKKIDKTNEFSTDFVNFVNTTVSSFTDPVFDMNLAEVQSLVYIGMVRHIQTTIINFVIIDVDSHESYASENSIRGIPTFRILFNNHELSKSSGGITSLDLLYSKLQDAFIHCVSK